MKTLRWIAVVVAAAALMQAANAETSSEVAFHGCVMKSPMEKETLILGTDSVCAKLTGKLATTKLAGHEVDLKGVLTPLTTALPASIQIDSVVRVGKTCSELCSLQPPGKRGIGKGGAKPGKEGGTPGETTTPPQRP